MRQPRHEIRRLAIVDRGEPAMRALDAVAELNRDGDGPRLTAVVVHTDPDAHAWFVRTADEAISLGPTTFVDPADGNRKSSYLDEERVVDAMRAAGIDAAWVGWGFVADPVSFARRCTDAGIVLVGPDSATIRLLGDEVAAGRLTEKVDVPVVPGSGAVVDTVEEAEVRAARLGYRARHVEVQVIADAYGTTWAVGVRDCSVQRGNQKVLEESGSTVLDELGERAIRDAAVRIAAAAGYRNAGTVEFLVEPDTGRFLFMDGNTHPQVEHPVTEATTGVDLVKLQLHVARGGRLAGEPPRVHGHAIEARLCAEDPELGFAPAPGRVALWRPPAGPGIRVDAGVTEGDAVVPEFDSLIAKVIAWGHDRAEAVARLRRALERTAVVIEGGSTNRAFLLSLLAHPDVQEGRADSRWLDRLIAAGEHLPEPEPFAVVMAAVEAYEIDDLARRAAFRAAADRGRPEPSTRSGDRVRLRYRGRGYDLSVFRTGPRDYRVDTADGAVDVAVERPGRYERRARCGGRNYRVLVTEQRASFLIEVDDTVHRVRRDDGGIVRAAAPAFVISVAVAPGDRVERGDPLAVLETMKMSSTITAPFAGVVGEVSVAANEQVERGAAILRIREGWSGDPTQADAERLDFTGLRRDGAADRPAAERVYAALRGYLLGFDLDPETAARVLTEQRDLVAPPDVEDALLEEFIDVAGLYRPQPEPDADPLAESAQEHMLSYLQWLDADRAGLPDWFRARLARALARYGVDSLERTPALEEAVVWLWHSFRRADAIEPAVTAILQRRLRHRGPHAAPSGPELRDLLTRLSTAAQARYPALADLARDVVFHYLDEPLLEQAVGAVYAEMDEHLDVLAHSPGRPDRAERVARLVWCPQPLRGTLLRWWQASPGLREVVLDVHLRRFYRIRDLRGVRFEERAGHLLGSADYDVDGRPVHVVAAYAPLAELASVLEAVAGHLQVADPGRLVVVELVTWRPGEQPDIDATAAYLRELLDGWALGGPLHRVDVTVTSERGSDAERDRTQHVTFRRPEGGGFVEDAAYRNLHPMIAKRLDLWRLENFALQRLRSVEDVLLFRGIAHDNPADTRLFAIAEVRDLTPVLDETGQVVALPLLTRMGIQSLAAMRTALTDLPPNRRPTLNRIVLYVRPPLTLPAERRHELGRPFAGLATGVGLEKLVLRVTLPDGDGLRPAVLELEDIGEQDVRVRLRPPAEVPIRPLTPYRQKVLRAARVGAPYPYEIIRMLTPAPGVTSAFPRGRFVEHDLGDGGELAPVDRPYGQNTANLVVGLVTSYPDKVPDGMTRVAILGDPTRHLGALAEPECRRIIGAIDLAERLGVPVEWFTLSSGARIAMDSGTENMDWIGAVLRRLIEFTQGGGEVNVIATGINVGGQPYWNAEATMLMHTRGILVMTPASALVLTGKQALDFSGVCRPRTTWASAASSG